MSHATEVIATLDQMDSAFAESFMKPQCYKGSDLDQEILAGLDWDESKYYGRLSADGYMDCTEWTGPFDTVQEVAQELISLYAD